MNLRPPGYEPGELPDCSTPRRGVHDSTASPPVSLAFVLGFWLSLLVLLTGLVGGCAYVVVRWLQLWRLVKRTGTRFGAETARISASAAQIERHLAEATAAAARLAEANARLADSRARLDVQRAALNEARADVRRTLWFVPGL